MAYDEIGVRLGEVLMRYGLDQLARRQDSKTRQEEYAQERLLRQQDDDARATRNAKLAPPQEREVEGVGADGKKFKRRDTWNADYDNPDGSRWSEGTPVMMERQPKRTERRMEGNKWVTYRIFDDGSEEQIAEAPRGEGGGGGGGERPASRPKKVLVQDKRTGQQRFVLDTDPIGPTEFAVSPRAYDERAAPRSKRDQPGILDRMAGAAESFADAAQRQAGATEKAEKPVQVRTDKQGRKWNIYADGTMELAEP